MPSLQYPNEVVNGDLVIELTNDFLKIYNKVDTGLNRETLTKKRWKQQEGKIKKDLVKGLSIVLINFSDSCQDVFSFIADCPNCIRVVMDRVNDTSPDNKDLSGNLSQALESLLGVQCVDIRSTDLGVLWERVLKALNGDTLEVLALQHNNLSGQGEVLLNQLSKLSHLQFLNLFDSGMTPQELLLLLPSLPNSCPLLRGLNIGRHNLSEGGERLIKLVENLPYLKLFVVCRCHLLGEVLAQVVHVLHPGIEVLGLEENSKVSNASAVLEQIKQFKSLKYMRISSGQFSNQTINDMKAAISEHDGYLLVDHIPEEEWKQYIGYCRQIYEMCISR